MIADEVDKPLVELGVYFGQPSSYSYYCKGSRACSWPHAPARRLLTGCALAMVRRRPVFHPHREAAAAVGQQIPEYTVAGVAAQPRRHHGGTGRRQYPTRVNLRPAGGIESFGPGWLFRL